MQCVYGTLNNHVAFSLNLTLLQDLLWVSLVMKAQALQLSLRSIGNIMLSSKHSANLIRLSPSTLL